LALRGDTLYRILPTSVTNVGSTVRKLFKPLAEEWLARSRFSRNSRLLDNFL